MEKCNKLEPTFWGGRAGAGAALRGGAPLGGYAYRLRLGGDPSKHVKLYLL